MSHGVFHDPDFDFDVFRSSVEQWGAAGAKRLIVEWQTGPGPMVAWSPAGERKLAAVWKANVLPTQYNELYADYLEYRLMPRLVELGRANGFEVRSLCVDQQPIQIMRMRRREIERAELASGVTAPAH